MTIPLRDGDEARRSANTQFETHVARCAAAAVRRQNMMLIHEYVMGDGVARLTPADRSRVFDDVWALQDGYGVAGYTPVQGFDWSGIRDSTMAAVDEMARAVRRVVGLTA